MANESMVGKVQTVLGAVEPSSLGIALTHEHLLIDLSRLFEPPDEAGARATYYAPLTQETLSRIRHYHEANLENYRLLDVDAAIDELGLYAQRGGGAVVDATSIGIARDPVGLARISRATGVSVIMGAAFYVDDAHPDYARRASADELAERIDRDVAEGVDGSGIRSGVIGEVGCSFPLTPNERKVLTAAAQAQRSTGAPILIHPGRGEDSPIEIIEALDQAGADLSRTIIGHLDRTVFERETLTAIGEAGCWFEWDLFGNESSYYRLNPDDTPPERRNETGEYPLANLARVRTPNRNSARHLLAPPSGKIRRTRLPLYIGAYRPNDARPRLLGRDDSRHPNKQPGEHTGVRRAEIGRERRARRWTPTKATP